MLLLGEKWRWGVSSYCCLRRLTVAAFGRQRLAAATSISTLGHCSSHRHFARPFSPHQYARCFAAVPAQKSANKRDKPHLNVGTIGHVDHGKTTLSSAITKFLAAHKGAKFVKYEDIDRSPQEKARGITINACHLEYETPRRHYAHTDCPGHRDFIKNMICGTAQMDAAVLVIAATDGSMPQTREHLLLARQLGLEHIVVFINKADLVDADVLDLVEMEARENLNQFGFDGSHTPVIRGSALAALTHGDFACIDALLNALDAIPEPARLHEAAVSMPVASRVSITGRGTVVIGTLEQGTLRKGDKIELVGARNSVATVASDIHVFGKSVPEARAGDHCGVLCRGLKADSVQRGMWLVTPGSGTCSNLFRVEMYLLGEAEGGKRTGIRSGFTDRVFCTTWDQIGRFRFDDDLLVPEEHGRGYLAFLRHMPAAKGLPIAVRNEAGTIARGVISEVLPSFAVTSVKDWRPVDKILKELKIPEK